MCSTLFGLRILDYGSWITDPGLRILDYGSRITDYGSRITDPGLRILDYGSRIMDPGLLITDPGLRIPDFQIPDPQPWIPHSHSLNYGFQSPENMRQFVFLGCRTWPFAYSSVRQKSRKYCWSADGQEIDSCQPR